MWMKETQFVVRVGSNTFGNCKQLITFRGLPLFNLYRNEGGGLGIDFEVYGPAGVKLATVKKNVIYPDPKVVDKSFTLKYTPNRVTLTDAVGVVWADITRNPPKIGTDGHPIGPAELDVNLATFLPDGRPFQATPTWTNLGNVIMSNCSAIGCLVGLNIG